MITQSPVSKGVSLDPKDGLNAETAMEAGPEEGRVFLNPRTRSKSAIGETSKASAGA